MIILIFVVGENAINPRPRHFEKRMVDVTLNTWIDQSLCELLRQAQLFIQLANRQRCEQIQVNLKRFPECASVRFLSGDEIENLFSTLPISNKTYTARNIKAHFTMSKNLSMTENLSSSKQRRLSQYQEEYQQLKEELQQVGPCTSGLAYDTVDRMRERVVPLPQRSAITTWSLLPVELEESRKDLVSLFE